MTALHAAVSNSLELSAVIQSVLGYTHPNDFSHSNLRESGAELSERLLSQNQGMVLLLRSLNLDIIIVVRAYIQFLSGAFIVTVSVVSMKHFLAYSIHMYVHVHVYECFINETYCELIQ